MADNQTVFPGNTGTSFIVAADDIAGVLYQRFKLTVGADGVNDGDVSLANPIPARIMLGTVAIAAGAGVVGTGVPRMTLASDDPAVVALQLIDNAVSGAGFNITQMNGVNVTMGNGASGSGVQRVTIASDSTGTVQDIPATSGGLTMHKTISAASTNATSVKASAGQVYAIQCSNVNAAARYLKLYNKASAPTVGTDTPVKTLIIPGNTAGAGFVINFDKGLSFSTGIAFALTTEATDAGTTGVAANELTVNIDYK